MSVRKLVKKLSHPIKQGLKYVYAFVPPRFRYGKVFWDTYNFLQESQWWSREKLEEYQMQQLKKLLQHAYENVPYYRRVFDERRLKPKDIQNFDDLKKLPYLTKDIFKTHFKEIVATNVKLKGLPKGHTSGTTGKPIQFYQDSGSEQKELAFIYHQWSRVGVKPGDSIIQLRGAIIEGSRKSYYDPINKVLRLSPRLDSKKTVCYYLEKMHQFGAGYFHGYPSSISIFASMIKKYGLPVRFKLKAVLFASESIYQWQKEITQEVFNCRIFSHYGMAERAVLAGECEKNNSYHCVPQYGFTEIHPETNEIIGTSFLNHVNPFIRYKTTDCILQMTGSNCNECGRQYYPVFSGIEGRLEDYIITPKGIPISPAVITFPFKEIKTIKSTQLIQTSLNRIKLKVVPWEHCSHKIFDEEIEQLCHGLQSMLGPEMKIETELVESIQHTKSGKFRWIISEVSRGSLEDGLKDCK